jgi:isoleucyl-tRNA synthetase
MESSPSSVERFSLGRLYEPKQIEETVRVYWEEVGLQTLLKKREPKEVVGYVEGPPTLNGLPHIGHMRGRMMKDLWHRRMTMKGIKVIFNGGWDTQGLPVELEAEKELGLKGSKSENLRLVGEERLVETCKSLIKKYHEPWLRSNRLIGLQMDEERAYWTYKDEYIEREWSYLKAAYEQGLLGEGFRVVPYCPSCQTSLSHEEVGLGYDTVEDPSVYYKVRLVDLDAYLIIWTTMPFTVITDELVGVHPDENYLEVVVGGERWIVGETRWGQLEKELHLEGKVVSSRHFRKGSEMEGLRYYPPLLEEVPGQKSLFEGGRVHKVVAEGFVDVNTGSGVVHLSPANGEEDFEVAQKRGLPIFSPFDDSTTFTSESGKYEGRFARDADPLVIEDLRRKGLLVNSGKLQHEYPLCWRSGHRLLYVARRAYFYWVDRIVDRVVTAAESVEYFYDPPRKRFINIVKEGRPWNITRERVWGTPLPVWVCKSCGNKDFFFSRQSIVDAATELPDGPGFELHRPWIDRVVTRCSKCGKRSEREPFVLDTWHNSGASPLASQGEKEYRRWFPVPFLTEGIDQTRGWAYSLLVENVLLTGKAEAPYRAFLFQGHVLDEKGEKMSKSKGNSIDALDLLTKNSVDLVRFYLLWKASPADSVSFSYKEMGTRPFQVLNTLYHLHLYYKINSSYDSFSYTTVKSFALDVTKNEGQKLLQDRWLISKLNGLVRDVNEHLEKCRFQDAARAVEGFIIGTLSQQYVQMTRSILWDDSEEGKPRRLAVYSSLAVTLETLDRLLHPIVPFITEYLHKAVFGSTTPLMLQDYPVPRHDSIDEALESEVDGSLELVSLANSARMRAGLKRRWPLRSLLCYGVKLGNESSEIVRELSNVRSLTFIQNLSDMPVKVEARLTKEGAKKAGRQFRNIVDSLSASPAKLLAEMLANGKVTMEVAGSEFAFDRGDVEFEVRGKDGYEAASNGRFVVAIDVTRDPELVSEGLVRDVARRFQALRKEKGYLPTDVLPEARIAGLDGEYASALESKKDRLLFLIRAKELKVEKERSSDIAWYESDMDGKTVYLYI